MEILGNVKQWVDDVLEASGFWMFCLDVDKEVSDDTHDDVKQPEYDEIVQAVYETVQDRIDNESGFQEFRGGDPQVTDEFIIGVAYGVRYVRLGPIY